MSETTVELTLSATVEGPIGLLFTRSYKFVSTAVVQFPTVVATVQADAVALPTSVSSGDLIVLLPPDTSTVRQPLRLTESTASTNQGLPLSSFGLGILPIADTAPTLRLYTSAGGTTYIAPMWLFRKPTMVSS